ncbi:MAG: hypothetical protein CMJ81_04570 [Planctomycetaceae bacterium]|nr:hypothetical protein [Planctomycetaceae bacterium]
MKATRRQSGERGHGGLVVSRRSGEAVTASWTELRAVGDGKDEHTLVGGETLCVENMKIRIEVVEIRRGRVVIWLGADKRVKFLRSELDDGKELENEENCHNEFSAEMTAVLPVITGEMDGSEPYNLTTA